MRSVSVLVAVALVISVPFAPAPSTAQPIPQDVTLLDPSIPSAGMAGATVAVYWLDTPNVWINPALASFQRGIRYRYGTTELASSAAGDVTLQSHQIFVGGYGIGLEISGKPVEPMGEIRLEFPRVTLTGDVVRSYEEVHALAFGVDLFSLLASLQAAKGTEPSPILRQVSLAVGHTWKDILRDRGRFTESDARDLGALVRVAPVDQIGGSEGAGSDTRYRLELAGGYSEQNNVGRLSTRRIGTSVRLTMAPGAARAGFIRDYGTPSIAFGLAWAVREEDLSSDTNHYGAEMSLWDLVYLRGGLDDLGGLRRAAAGAGIALTYRKAIGVRLDYAWNERTGDQVDWSRFQATAFLDPSRLW